MPRYAEDLTHGKTPSTWVYQMYAEGVLFLPYGNSSNYPALVLGITDPNYGWQESGVHYGGQGEMNNWGNSFTFTNQYAQKNDKGADMNLVTYEYEPQSKLRDTYMAYVAMSVVDEESPQILELNPPQKWVGGTWAAVPSYAFEDPGLGVETASIGWPGEVPLAWPEGFGCNGTTASPCPRVVKSSEAGRPALAFNPTNLPTGKDKLEVAVADAIGVGGTPGHVAKGFVVVKADTTVPEVTLSGSLTEQGTLGTRRPAYALRVNAKDGTEAAPQSGIAKVEVKVDGKKVTMPEEADWAPNCQTQNCSLSNEWGLNASDFAVGSHEVQVIATDAAGNVATRKVMIELHPPAPTLNVSGTITEQATLGTSRPRYKLKINASATAESPLPASTPSLSSAFGSSGSGNGQFSHPGDVGIDPGGNLWVVDTSNNRVEEFNPSGGYLMSFGGVGSTEGKFNRPTAIAIDAKENLWVVDSGNKRIEEFSHAGAYLKKFGAAGTGNGQFAGSGPEGIAIDYHGNIWVSDTYGGRLEKFNENGEYIRSVATRGTGSGQLLEPTGLDIGPGGDVWVTDWGCNRVVEFGAGGAYVRQFGSEGTGNGEFRHPDGIAIDSKGDVWVADQNNERVQEFNQGGEYIGKFGAAGSGTGQFNLGYPIGIATDAGGNIWVTDTGNNRIEKWNSANYATAGLPSYVSSFGISGTTAGYFNSLTGIAIDAKGNVWTSDIGSNLIQKFSTKGELLGAWGGPGTENNKYNAPVALSTDSGHVWIGDTNNNRVQELNESGAFLSKFGSLGVSTGQYFNQAYNAAVDASHHLWVADAQNNRVQEFTEAGSFIRSVSSLGAAGTLNYPSAVAAGPGGKIWVSDYGHNRIVELSETGAFLRQFGGSASEVGSLSQPMGIVVDSHENVWVVDRLHSRIVEFNGRGEYDGQFGSAGSGPGAFNTPQYIALDSSNHLYVADMGNHRVQQWTVPKLHSQISTEIAVDRKRVESAEAPCEAETCATQREWTLESSSLSPGLHTVEVKATDGLGNTTTKTVKIEIAKDTTKPTLEVGGELANAPQGWVEQETYGLQASATDPGYGVTSLAFKIDGTLVASQTQVCADGGCLAAISANVDMGKYEGGAHMAEVVAVDGAGNKSEKRWTLNVDPEGHISTEEAEATLEAVEDTSSINAVGPAVEEEEIEGTGPGLGIVSMEPSNNSGTEEITTGYETTESSVPVVIGAEPQEGAEYHVLPENAFVLPCAEGNPQGTEPACLPQANLEALAKAQEEEVANGMKYPGLQRITITPVTTSSSADSVVNVNEASTIAPNTAESVDTVMRPLTDGGLSFETIRAESAPLHYAFEMNLDSDLELKQISDQQVGVYYKEGFPAFSITAQAAHDAIGTTVPTHLAVTGTNVITLSVDHQSPSPAGGSFVYPVVAGTGWEGGFRTSSVSLSEPAPESTEEQVEEETGAEEAMSVGRVATIGPPIEFPDGSLPALLRDPTTVKAQGRSYRIEECTWEQIWGPGSANLKGRPAQLPSGTVYRSALPSRCTGERISGVGSTFEKGYVPHWALMMQGHFVYKRNIRVWINDPPNCYEWGHAAQKPVQISCYGEPTISTGHIDLYGQYRFAPGLYSGVGFQEMCVELNPTLSPDPPAQADGRRILHEKWHMSRALKPVNGSCDWHHLHQVY